MKLTASLLIALASAEPAFAQQSDSVAARRSAERAQARFEGIRRMNLPIRHTGGRAECDARIGRFCHWNSSDDTIVAPDSRTVVRARAALLASLEDAARRSPRDGWITGQRVRYLLETGDDSTAVMVAQGCRATAWWCDALRGLALHEGAAGEAADSAFARALRAMPDSERCRWSDVTPLLEQEHRRRFGRMRCGGSERVTTHLWWLSDPFLSVPGNDRQTEHYSRHTMARILAPARIVYNLRWSNDLREMIVRYGWARYWTRGPASSIDPYSGAISGHEATPYYHFVPQSLSPDSLDVVEYDLDLRRSAERYSPKVANRVVRIAPQVALFRRADSAEVVVAFDESRRQHFDSAAVRSALVLASSGTESTVLLLDGARGTFNGRVAQGSHLVSLEIVNPETRRAAWFRTGVRVPPREGVQVSDILLFEPGEAEVRGLEDAIPMALPGSRGSRGKTGLYWEIYGLAAADSALPVSLTLTPVGQSTWRRIGESIGLAPRTSPLHIAWRDTPSLGGVSSRSMVLDMSLVPRGRYVIRVEVSPTGRPAGTSSRVIEIQ